MRVNAREMSEASKMTRAAECPEVAGSGWNGVWAVTLREAAEVKPNSFPASQDGG
jgi:hypothetical protein